MRCERYTFTKLDEMSVVRDRCEVIYESIMNIRRIGKSVWSIVKSVLNDHSQKDRFSKDRLSLNAGQKYCRMLKGSILQYFPPSLSYYLSLRPLLCLFLSDRFTQVLLYHQLASQGVSGTLD